MNSDLCTKCKKFFGSQKSNFMCSKCYNEYKKENKINEELEKIQIKPPPSPKQKDHSLCMICRKKIGLLGFKCKQCDCSYCKKHRLPQDHNCQVDFQERARQQIEKKNPQISAPKIQEI